MRKQLVVIGGGPAGLAAAVAAYDAGVRDLVVLERESEAGGILKQCVHNGFGLTRFRESMTGPEYARRFLDEARARRIGILTNTFVTRLTLEKRVSYVNEKGAFCCEADAVILAMGCRERSKGALNIAGTRPAGLFSAGTAQKYVNIYGHLPGKRVVILGSGDIGLIMARRMTLEGAKVECVCEIMPYSGGLRRNIAQCLDDFGIPLLLEHTIVSVEGRERVEAVVIARVDEKRQPIAGTERRVECDTVLFSVGLIPENELTKGAGIALDGQTKGCLVDDGRETEIGGVFACGNVLHVHDLVDFVSEEAEIAGRSAAEYLLHGARAKRYLPVLAGENVSYIVPQRLDADGQTPVQLYFRVKSALRGAVISVEAGDFRKSVKRIAVAPGEMERVTVVPSQLSGAAALRVSVFREE